MTGCQLRIVSVRSARDASSSARATAGVGLLITSLGRKGISVRNWFESCELPCGLTCDLLALTLGLPLLPASSSELPSSLSLGSPDDL